MSEFRVCGSKPLIGSVTISGAKNSALPILAASLLINGEAILHNCPDISDVRTTLKILESIGCKCKREKDIVTVNSYNAAGYIICDELMREMRSSIIFLGAVVSRFKEAVMCSPGGCELGPRPIDLHLKALSQMGMKVTENNGKLHCRVRGKFHGEKTVLSIPSVGATENIIIAAVLADGITTIENAAREPEIVDLAEFLNSAGADIRGAGNGTVVINGVSSLHNTEHKIIPDRIEAATFLAAGAITGSDILIKGAQTRHILPVIDCFEQAGCNISQRNGVIRLKAPEKLNSIDSVRTMYYPGFPTDSGPILISSLLCSSGSTVFVENIFRNRYNFIGEIHKFGADVTTEERIAVVRGVKSLHNASVTTTDLRGGAAMMVAALKAEGETVIKDIHHIDRGYEKIEEKLKLLSADVERVETNGGKET